jgi:hypothetical protein
VNVAGFLGEWGLNFDGGVKTDWGRYEFPGEGVIFCAREYSGRKKQQLAFQDKR